MKHRVRKLRGDEHPDSIGRWVVDTPTQGGVYFWAFADWAGALRFALWKVGRLRNYAEAPQ